MLVLVGLYSEERQGLGDWTSFCRWAIYVTCLPAWVGCLVKVPSTGRTRFACYPPLPLDRDCEARVDPDITGTGTGPTTSESTPPAHATRATRPATYLSTRWGTDGHGSAGLPEISEDCAESVLLYVFYVCGAALCFSLHRNRDCGVQSDLYRSSLTTHSDVGTNR